MLAVADVTRMESSMSFFQMGSAISLQEKIRQVRHEICQNRRQTASVRLDAITGADNPSSLIQVFRRGHIIAKSGEVAFVTRCNPVEVPGPRATAPRRSPSCGTGPASSWTPSGTC